MQTAFVRFKAPDWTPEEETYLPDIFSLFDNGVIRATLPAEWDNRVQDETQVNYIPMWMEAGDQLPRYKTYDQALRDPDLDADD